jgi:hypothetical protein
VDGTDHFTDIDINAAEEKREILNRKLGSAIDREGVKEIIRCPIYIHIGIFDVKAEMPVDPTWFALYVKFDVIKINLVITADSNADILPVDGNGHTTVTCFIAFGFGMDKYIVIV